MAYRVERVADEGALAELAKRWTALLDEMPGAAIFLTWEWVSAWWRNREPGWELWVLAAWDDAGRLAGLAPWMLAPVHASGLTVRRISFVRNSGMVPNHMDLIAAPDEAVAVCAAFLGYLEAHRGAWDALDLEALRPESAIRPALRQARGVYRERDPFVCPYVTLPDSWEAYERGTLSANRRQQMRSRRRKLERDYAGQVVFRRVTNLAELPAALATLIAFNLTRWHDKGLHASFDDECFLAFQRDFAPLALARGWLRFYQLMVAGQVIATEYCFRYGETFVNYQRGFDQGWDRYSPGQVLYAYAIGEAIAEGARRFDMLRGAHEYKLSWSDETQFDGHPVISRSWRGHAWLLRGTAFDRAQSVGRRVVPPELRERINLYLGSRKR
jgi:CelD/BcsL family acetyltransferase involved in cellulose biosynthesis